MKIKADLNEKSTFSLVQFQVWHVIKNAVLFIWNGKQWKHFTNYFNTEKLFYLFLNISDSIPFISYILLPIKASTQMTQEWSKYFYSTKTPSHINVFLAILGWKFHKLRWRAIYIAYKFFLLITNKMMRS